MLYVLHRKSENSGSEPQTGQETVITQYFNEPIINFFPQLKPRFSVGLQ